MTILWAVLIIVAVMLAAAFIPVFYRLDIRVDKTAVVKVKLTYFVLSYSYAYDKGRSSSRTRLLGIPLGSKRRRKKKQGDNADRLSLFQRLINKIIIKIKSKNVKAPLKEPKEWYNGASLLTSPDLKIMMGVIYRYISKLAKAMLPKRYFIEGEIGTGDPYHTGLLLGAYETISGCLNIRPNVRFVGDFNQAVFKVDAAMSGHVCIMQLAWPTLCLIVEKPIFGIIKTYFRG